MARGFAELERTGRIRVAEREGEVQVPVRVGTHDPGPGWEGVGVGRKSQGKGSKPRKDHGADHSGRSKAAPRSPATPKPSAPVGPPAQRPASASEAGRLEPAAPQAPAQAGEALRTRPPTPAPESARPPGPALPARGPEGGQPGSGAAPSRATSGPQPQPALAGRPRRSLRTACYVDFENLFYTVVGDNERTFNVRNAVRELNGLSRVACGEGFVHTAVYASWDGILGRSRHIQEDWANHGWRPVPVPAKEDSVSGRLVKNLVDFVMSLDMLQDAYDRDYDHFFVVSGDADFCEVVDRLKRLRRKVTVVALSSALSFRLREAADDCHVWELEQLSGKDTLPLAPARKMPKVSPGLQAHPDADEWEKLKVAWRVAQEQFGTWRLDWETVRDEYYLVLARCGPEEADAFVRQLAEAGFVILKPYRARDGSQRHHLRLLA